jgi:hypothetical protein
VRSDLIIYGDDALDVKLVVATVSEGKNEKDPESAPLLDDVAVIVSLASAELGADVCYNASAT